MAAAKQFGIDFDADRCVECHACELACKVLNNVDLGIKWRRVTRFWSGRFPNIVSRSISFSCMHCGDPACESVCPTGAIKKRVEDGAVIVNKDRCIGCRLCLTACPFGAPSYGADGKMQKCDLCAERLLQGKEPACVATCPSEALRFGTVDELTEEKNIAASGRILRPLLSDAST